jgi:hypothetical protein
VWSLACRHLRCRDSLRVRSLLAVPAAKSSFPPNDESSRETPHDRVSPTTVRCDRSRQTLPFNGQEAPAPAATNGSGRRGADDHLQAPVDLRRAIALATKYRLGVVGAGDRAATAGGFASSLD